MTDEERRVFEYALHHYGVQHQERKLFEEMGELIQAISKYEDGEGGAEHIAEEIGDVSILLDQMILAFQCGGLVQRYRLQKTERLLARMQGREPDEDSPLPEAGPDGESGTHDGRQWISAATPPPEGKSVLCFCVSGAYDQNTWMEVNEYLRGKFRVCNPFPFKCRVTHWMKLPEAPEEETI